MANTDEAETIPVEGIDVEEVTAWFEANVAEAPTARSPST